MEFREIFGKSDDYFNGYFTKKEITDLDEDLIAATITEDDLTKISRQLDVSMGNMFQLINVFAIVLFALLIYLLTKLIIEKNATAISMVKILGYEDKEIRSLYLTSTTWVVILSILLSLILSTWTIHGIYGYLMESFSGWLTLYLEPVVYPEMFAMGMGAYILVAILQFRRIRKIPMDIALKM
ncbi:MAG: FtsX-like permease family protein [Blautia sp.]